MFLRQGSYRIEKVLGQGGFGITYLAEQVLLGRKVAIKEFFMKEHCNRDANTFSVSVPSVGSRETVERFRQKFLKEARTIASFVSSNIVNVIDVFEENGTAYYVMEYLDGKSLGAIVAECGALDEALAVRYICQVADALMEVHGKNLLHLDIKPANVMLDSKGNAVLIDFGISKHYDDEGSQTSSGHIGISDGYAPMEQYKKGGLDSFTPATDIYALGAMLFKLVTSVTPPHASDINDDGLPALPDSISPAVRSAIKSAMQPRRKDRPQSIAEFLKLLENRGKSKDERAESKDETLLSSSSTPGGEVSRSDGGESELKTENRKSKLPLIIIILLFSVILGAGGYMLFSVGSSHAAEKQALLEREAQAEERERIAAEQAAAEEQARLERESEEKRAREEAERIAREKQQGIFTQQKVDLGLSVKWATCNVGASSPEEYGGYYAWGETEEKRNYDWSTYKWYNGSNGTMTKYCRSSNYGTVDNKTTLDPQDDVAHVKWGGSWRMPTLEEQKELLNNCTWTWTTHNGVKGYEVTGPNGNSIFLPAAGHRNGSDLSLSGSYGLYWSSSLSGRNSLCAYDLRFQSGYQDWYDNYYRFSGRSVRPVSK